MLSSKYLLTAALFSCAAGLSACVIDTRPGDGTVVEDTGLVTMDITLDDSKDPDACYVYGATDIELVVYDVDGYEVARGYAPCESFAISAELYDGLYSADLTLVDPANYAVSTTLIVDDVDVRGGTDLVIDVDFPLGSVL